MLGRLSWSEIPFNEPLPLLSGAVIQIGDLQVDATARGRLDALREHLVPGGWEDRGFGLRGTQAASTTTQIEGAG